ARVEYYIRNVMNYVYNHEYCHLVYAWDLVNEYYHSNPTMSDWLRVYGEQGLTPCFVKLAYQVADDVLRDFGIREQVSLIFNDYNTFEGNTPEALISIVEFINSDGKICDGIGMQAHLDIEWPKDANTFTDTVKKFLAEGLEVQITELDITIRNPRQNSEEEQLERFRKVFTDLLEIKRNGGDITALTIWGIADHTSWLKEYSPLLFETYETPKDAYYAVIQAYLDAGFKVK
ncbi:MAG: endo-1,4-beta-xylanase, partial [Lachnospiraceae bacterium]|nr:endo-1,4-beta-xylanase [Lachnospiraceae bacterium]